MTAEETGGETLDVILISGDAYVDHPAWGTAVIGRWLEAHGFSVGVIAQPEWENVEAFRVLGRPRLFFGVTAGNMDSMVNRFTASRRLRSDDAYSPGGQAGLRPDRATVPYTAKARQAYKGVPVIIGGVEASLRRLVHYDYWQDRVRGSILVDSKADLLVHGMGERAVLEIARRLDAGKTVRDCRDIAGVAWCAGAKDELPSGDDVLELPSLESCRQDPVGINTIARVMVREANPHSARTLLQRHGDRAVIVRPPAMPLSTEELDRVHELPFAFAPHPCYRAPIPALQSIEGSITVNRGCSGGCSFCALTLHQGKDVVSRSQASVMRELDAMTERPGWKGIITDMGGPTANMFHMRCTNEAANKVCNRVSCLHPTRCQFYGTDHGPYLDLLRAARSHPRVRHVYVNSGIRYDLASLDPHFVEELAEHHVQGQLSVAPEHVGVRALAQMRKPAIEYFTEFMLRFRAATEQLGKKQFLVPYFQCAHPGVGPQETVELALYMKEHNLRPRQVQLFIPTPSTLSTAIFYTGLDPMNGKEVYVARGSKERARQRALLFWWKREEAPHVREALRAWGRTDLIGRGPQHLVPPGEAYGSWTTTDRSVRFDTHMGLKVERATADEQAEERWEG